MTGFILRPVLVVNASDAAAFKLEAKCDFSRARRYNRFTLTGRTSVDINRISQCSRCRTIGTAIVKDIITFRWIRERVATDAQIVCCESIPACISAWRKTIPVGRLIVGQLGRRTTHVRFSLRVSLATLQCRQSNKRNFYEIRSFSACNAPICRIV